jgi:hypothetical protein
MMHTLRNTRRKVYVIYNICLSLQVKTYIVNNKQYNLPQL